MKQILLISALLIGSICFAQSTVKCPCTIKRGTSTYWTLNGQDYPRNGYLRFQYYYHASDSTVSIIYANSLYGLVPTSVDTMFVWDSSGTKVRSVTALQTWLRANAY